MNIQELVEQLEAMANKGARFCSCTYTAKKTGETARYLLGMNVNYVRVCQRDITEMEIMLREAKPGIEEVVIGGLIASLKESILCREQDREHAFYTKAGMYRSLYTADGKPIPGIRIFLKDQTLELGGFEHKRVVLIPGEHKPVKHRTEETALRAKLTRKLKRGKFRTLCLDPGCIHGLKLNGTVIEFE